MANCLGPSRDTASARNLGLSRRGPFNIVSRVGRVTSALALGMTSWCASAVPITMIFTGSVVEAPLGPGIRPLSGQVRLTYSFDSNLPAGSGPVPTMPGTASYGPIMATLDFLGSSFALPLSSGITVFQLPHSYSVRGQAHNVVIDGTFYSEVSFSFFLSDDDNRAFQVLALPLDTRFVAEIDRFQADLRADGRNASGLGPPSTFTLVVPENGTASMLAVGLLAVSGLALRRRAATRRRASEA